MGADTSAQPAGQPNAQRTPMVAAIAMRERGFWTGLAFAAVVHAALLVGFLRAPPRMMGEASGLADGISVELVEAPDPKSKNTFAEDGGQPGTAAKPVPKPPQKQAAAEPQEPQPPAPPKSDPLPQRPETPPVAREAQPAEPQPKSKPWAAEIEALQKAPPPAPAEEPKQPAEEAPKTPPAKKQQQAELPKQLPQPEAKPKQKLSLQLDLPPSMQFMPGTQGAAVTRPAGITRSGENDEFGRGVIRALRKTMPASNVLGRVTVRFLISQTGNLTEVRLISGGGDPILSQNVVFAVKQSSFPFPPPGATEVDRTFQVTYVYH
jgi:TonB family protein